MPTATTVGSGSKLSMPVTNYAFLTHVIFSITPRSLAIYKIGALW